MYRHTCILSLLAALTPVLAQTAAPGPFTVGFASRTSQPVSLAWVGGSAAAVSIDAAAGQSLADLRFTSGARVFSTAAGEVLAVRAGEPLSRTVTVAPRSADGQTAPYRVTQTYTVYPEGALLCDFTISVPAGAPAASVDRVELTCSFPSALFPKFRWFYKRDWRGDLDLPREQTLDTPGYLRVMGASFSAAGPGYSNHWEMFVEKKAALAGKIEDTMSCRATAEEGGRKAFTWTLYHGAPLPLAPGFTYNNRFGMDLCGPRLRSNAIGQRIAHWQEGNAALMTFPSDSAIAAMADCGVTVCVLHLYWKAPGWGSNFTAFDEAEMKRWVTGCHARGIKCVLYAIPIDKPGLDGITAESYPRYGCDGLYFDFGSVHFRGDRAGDAIAWYEGRDFPAQDFLKLTRQYRQVVGPDGIMIAHAGGGAPDALYCLNLDAYLPGEAGEQGGLLARPLDAAYYHSGLAYAVCHPWCEYERFQTRHAVANFCALGAFPHVLFGRGTHQDNNYSRSVYQPARFVLPYWQMLRCLPMDKGTAMHSAITGPAVSADQADVHCVAYRRAAGEILITYANLGEACAARLTVDREVLQASGNLQVVKVGGPDIAQLAIDDLGVWDGKPLPTGPLATDDYGAFVLVDAAARPALEKRLADIRHLVGEFRDKQAPGAVPGLTAAATAAAVQLSWQPAPDDSHVVAYRLSRLSGTEEEKLGDIEETLQYTDYTAPPGVSSTYRLAGVDVAGNVGPAATCSAQPAGGSLLSETLRSQTSLQPVSGEWRFAAGWYEQSSAQPPADEKGVSYDLKGTRARFLRVLFTGGQGNLGCAHVIELSAKSPEGKALTPRQAISSGDDKGHPVSDIIDGVTDKTRNGWWSDRNKPLPAWAGLDFGEPVALGQVWLLTYWDGSRRYEYSVEVSEDGQEWRSLAAIAGATRLARALGSLDFSDGAVSVTTLETAPERSGGGLLLRCSDNDSGYAFYLDNGWDGNVCLARLEKGKLRLLKSFFFPYSIHRPIPHLLRVEAKGGKLVCYADGVRVFEVQDATYKSGKVGLFSLTGGPLRFRNLLVDRGE